MYPEFSRLTSELSTSLDSDVLEGIIIVNNKKNTKGIYGNATKKQVSELQEEGIETQIFPWIENKKN